MKATKIKMKAGCGASNNLLEIDEIYISESLVPGFYKKEFVHDWVKKSPGCVQVGTFPYPNVIAAVSVYGEKYVKSSANSTTNDNLLSLPRV